MKICSACGETKPLETFARDKRRSDGRGSYCKSCENARNRALAARNTARHIPAPAKGTKMCSACGQTKPLTEFGRRKDSPTGFRSACNLCKRVSDAKAMRRWRNRNPELDRQRAREWVESHREQERQRYRRYDEANREQRRAAISKSRAANPEHHRELLRQQRRANPARTRDAWYRWYEDTRDPSSETITYIDVLLHDPCAYCQGPMAHIDHIEPRSLGGTHDWTNLTASCGSCNPSKGNRPLLYWLTTR